MTALQGRVAIVTGAGRGIGRGIALEYALEGASVVVASRSPDTVDSVVAEIHQAGGTACGAVCDVGYPEQIHEMVDAAVARYGTVDILVNNAQSFGSADSPAGSPTDRDLETFPLDEWDWMFQTGVKATLSAMQAVFPHMKRAGAGKIINFGSRIGIVCRPHAAAYAANKEAIRALTRVAANEWGRHQINVNVINPSAATPAGSPISMNTRRYEKVWSRARH
jgi:NAD(P)-dependent dehydrogenase (short-subunit alcohol dehydrogenase family)